jgi:hypothetical protein
MLAGCGSSSGTVPQPALTALPSLSPSPGTITTVTGKAEDGHAASGTVTVAGGGQVTATGSDGTRYQLDVPAYSVAGNVTVTITPLTEVRGGVGDGPRHVVRFTPDGLRFLSPATLTITPASAAGPSAYFSQTGDDTPEPVYVAPVNGAAVMLIRHFSIAGELGVNDSAIDSAFGVIAGDQLETASRDVAKLSQLARAAAILTDNGSAEVTAFTQRLLQYEELINTVILLPAIERMATQATRCSDANMIAEAILTQDRMLQLAGGETSTNAVRAMQAAHANCERQEIAFCKQTGNTQRLISLWISQARQKLLLGIEPDLGDPVTKADELCHLSYSIDGGGNFVRGKGTVCSLLKPFTVSGRGTTVKFVPTSAIEGTFTYSGVAEGFKVFGHGTYVVTADDTGGRIVATGPDTIVTPAGTKTFDFEERYGLTRLKPGCS